MEILDLIKEANGGNYLMLDEDQELIQSQVMSYLQENHSIDIRFKSTRKDLALALLAAAEELMNLED